MTVPLWMLAGIDLDGEMQNAWDVFWCLKEWGLTGSD